MSFKLLQIQHLDDKIQAFTHLTKVPPPPKGWIKAVRTALGMSMEQLGSRLSVTKQSIQELEKREEEGNITLKSLKELGRALDMQLVYGFVPTDGTLHAMIERRATELATQIVLRTSNTMKLEDQENSKRRIEKAIKERASAINNEMPKILWD